MTLQTGTPSGRCEEEIKSLRTRLEAAEVLAEEKERMDLEYRASRKRFETVFDESALGKKIIDAGLRIIKVNKSLAEILQYSQQELLGMNIVDISHPDFIDNWEVLRKELWGNHRQSFSIDACIIRKDGTALWCHVTSIIFEDNGDTLGYTVIEDISERKRLEQIEMDMQAQKLLLQQQAEVVKATLNTQEKERERIAEGLHNSLGQLLFAAQIELNQVNPRNLDERQLTALRKASDLLHRLMKECRQISHQLMPVILHDLGLRAAIRSICKDMTGAVEFTCDIRLQNTKNDKYFEIVVYRLVQELMLNIGKHAQATRGRVSIEESESKVLITVQDNGRGFDVEAVHGKGIGFISIRNNVALLNGRFEIESVPGTGSTVRVWLPNA